MGDLLCALYVSRRRSPCFFLQKKEERCEREDIRRVRNHLWFKGDRLIGPLVDSKRAEGFFALSGRISFGSFFIFDMGRKSGQLEPYSVL